MMVMGGKQWKNSLFTQREQHEFFFFKVKDSHVNLIITFYHYYPIFLSDRSYAN